MPNCLGHKFLGIGQEKLKTQPAHLEITFWTQKLITYHSDISQCDQMWQFCAIWAIFKNLGRFFPLDLFTVGQFLVKIFIVWRRFWGKVF